MGIIAMGEDNVGASTLRQRGRSETDGDLTAEGFADLYRTHLPAIYRFLRSRTPSEQDAEDIAQQVFLKAYRSRSGFRW